MPRYYSYLRICIYLLASLYISSCQGQGNTTPQKETTNKAKPIPEITGTPPTFIPQAGLPNDSFLVSQYIRTIFEDSNGNLWFGPAGQGVARYDGNTLHYFSKAEFFAGNTDVKNDFFEGSSVHAITEDQNGNLWFGTFHGVVKYDGQFFKSYNEKNGLGNINVGRKSIVADKSGNIWVGTAGGVFRYDPAADGFSPFNLIPPINITGIMDDKRGNIWIASENNGVYRYDPKMKAAEGKALTNITGKEGLGDNYAGGMAEDKAGNIWFVIKDGITRYDGKTFTDITAKDGLGGDEFWGIFIETSGIIWVTARGSTTRYDPSIPISDPNAFSVFTPADGLNCCVQSMYQDRSGNMWWGTGQGLYRFDGTHFYQVKQTGPW